MDLIVDVVADGTVLHSTAPSSVRVEQLAVTGGDVTIDASRTIRSTCTIALSAADSLVPGDLTGLLSPFGPAVIRVAAVGDTGDPSPLGIYVPSDITITEGDDGAAAITIQGRDRAERAARCRLPTPRVVAAGSNAATTLERMILDVDPAAEVWVTDTLATLPAGSWDTGTTWLDMIVRTAAGLGMAVWVDRLGRWRIEPPVDQAAQSATRSWSRDRGQILAGAQRVLSSDGTVNGVVVRGESLAGDAAPVTGEAWLDDTASPLYHTTETGLTTASVAGPMPVVIDSQTASTETLASTAAAAELARRRGLPERLSLPVLWDPTVDVDQLAIVDHPTIGASGQYQIERVTWPLDVTQPMAVVMRERRLR